MKNLSNKVKAGIILLMLFLILWASCYLSDLIGEKKSKKNSSTASSNTSIDVEEYDITFKYGQLGKYGRNVSMAGDYFIVYEVPAGMYKLIGLSSFSTLFYSSNNLVYEQGYYIYDLLQTIKLYKGDTYLLNIKKDTNFELSINSYVALELID